MAILDDFNVNLRDLAATAGTLFGTLAVGMGVHHATNVGQAAALIIGGGAVAVAGAITLKDSHDKGLLFTKDVPYDNAKEAAAPQQTWSVWNGPSHFKNRQ